MYIFHFIIKNEYFAHTKRHGSYKIFSCKDTTAFLKSQETTRLYPYHTECSAEIHHLIGSLKL